MIDILKHEAKLIAGIFAFVTLVLTLLFSNESFSNIIKLTLILFLMYVIPGYLIMFWWFSKLKFSERLVIGSALAAGLNGALGYYFGLAGIHNSIHSFFGSSCPFSGWDRTCIYEISPSNYKDLIMAFANPSTSFSFTRIPSFTTSLCDPTSKATTFFPQACASTAGISYPSHNDAVTYISAAP